MKMTEITETVLQDLVVAKDDAQTTVLQDPKTKVTVNVPKQAGKQGMIKANDKGEFEFNPEEEGESEQTLKPGTTVKAVAPK